MILFNKKTPFEENYFMKLTVFEKKKVINCCNIDLIPDVTFNESKLYPIEWFKQQFNFIDDLNLREHLADTYYQTRFAYSLMRTLSLPLGKHKGILKLQIIEYASICEALLNYTITKYFKDEFESTYASVEYQDISNSISNLLKVSFDGHDTFFCKKKTKKASITYCSNPQKAEFAFKKGIITLDTMNAYCTLYDLRNNAHILKAAANNYYPKIKEAKSAYELLYTFIAEIRSFFVSNPT